MSVLPNNILNQLKKRWRLKRWLEVCFYVLGFSLLSYFLFFNSFITISTFVIVTLFSIVLIKPLKPSLRDVVNYIDRHLKDVEYSSGLLLIPEQQLSNIAKLQRHRIGVILNKKHNTLRSPHSLVRGSAILITLVLISLIIYQLDITISLKKQIPQTNATEIVFTAIDSVKRDSNPPKLKNQQITITYPKYTGLAQVSTTEMNIKAVEGTELSWKLEFEGEIADVTMESLENSYPMKFVNNTYIRTSKLNSSGFYNFKFSDKLGTSYVSELYAIEVLPDKSPRIEVKGIKQFTSFSFDQNKDILLSASIYDDFGIHDVYLVATVSKGSGEAVKFREEKLYFDDPIPKGNKKLTLQKNINLDKIKMNPGDELYFYIEALDQKGLKPNVSRSETYFAVIKDTVSDQFAVEGTMGVDLMPDYFRSQRQLIIDTEKLIRNRSKFSKKEFKYKSNELGFDQKVLRQRYAEFMGDESEMGTAHEENEETHDHEEEESNDDPLAQYTHNHDSENEHHLVEEEKDLNQKKDPLQEYLHNHDDPEESTLFTQSLKSKLRQALNEMWDAELHLRLYDPKKSLPYQYKALKLIQEIKNSARIYVHRIGFDPAPIKEDKRLTGKIDEVTNYSKKEKLTQKDEFASVRLATKRIELHLSENNIFSDKDILVLKNAGNELAVIAIKNPGKYLGTLQELKKLIEIKKATLSSLKEIQKGLYMALPTSKPNPTKTYMHTSKINELLLKELDNHD